jgi:hypothetical protein
LWIETVEDIRVGPWKWDSLNLAGHIVVPGVPAVFGLVGAAIFVGAGCNVFGAIALDLIVFLMWFGTWAWRTLR